MLELRTVRVVVDSRSAWLPVRVLVGPLLALGGMLLAAGPQVGCSGGSGGDATPTPGPVNADISVTENHFSPTEITAGPGQSFTVVLHNNGTEQHSIAFELPAGEVQLSPAVDAGGQGTLEVNAPDDLGNYTFYCPIDDHFQKGEEGTLIVSNPVDEQ